MAAELSIAASECDLSIVIDNALKMPAQCSMVVKKTNHS